MASAWIPDEGRTDGDFYAFVQQPASQPANSTPHRKSRMWGLMRSAKCQRTAKVSN